MPKHNLTPGFISSLKAEKQTDFYDEHTAGLGLRISPGGTKTFFYRYRFKGKTRRFTIDRFSKSFTLSDARAKVDELRSYVKKGGDPQGERQAEKYTERPKTIGELAEQFKLQYISKELKKSTQSSYKCRLKKIEDKFSKRFIDDLTRAEIKRFLKDMAESQPYNANRVQAIFSKMYSFAIKEEYTENHPLKKLEKFGEEKEREPNYGSNEIRALWESFETEREPIQSLLKMLLICGQRLGETSRMRWKDIDTENSLWIIPKQETKGKKTHVVPLSDMAVKILENLHQLTGNSEYVFRSPNKDNAPLSHFGATAERIREKSKLSNFKIHDLRHTVITGMISIGIDFVHVGKTVAHKGLGKEYVVTNRYAHYEYMEEKRKALQRWSNHLQQVITGKETKIFKIG